MRALGGQGKKAGVFSGIPKGTPKFLSELSRNNEKAWFDEHRADYESYFVEPAKALVTALAAPLKKLDPNIHAEPRVNGSILRINRDVRFSKDETPYKDHLATLRIQKTQQHEPLPYTALGWKVGDISVIVKALAARQVPLERFPGLEQDARGVWTAPSGAKIAWFKDPDGNVLSLTE